MPARWSGQVAPAGKLRRETHRSETSNNSPRPAGSKLRTPAREVIGWEELAHCARPRLVARAEQMQSSRCLPRLCLLSGPALALRVSDALARLGAKYPLPSGSRFGGCFFGPSIVSRNGSLSGAGKQGTHLMKPGDFSIDLCDNRVNSHRSRITQEIATAQIGDSIN